MESFWIGVSTAMWLGLLTSISPCPLATNIAAISYIGKRLDQPRRVIAAGVLYTIGRALTYVMVGALVVASLLTAPVVSTWLQVYLNKLLGPVLIIVGMFLLELLKTPSIGASGSSALRVRLADKGLWGAGALGMLFALSFCPTSAALFFGSLVPLSLKWQSGIVLPSIYGIGTAVPVFAFALVVVAGARSADRIFHRVIALESWGRRITGVIFILVGVYFSFTYIFQSSNG
jgi:cytochrome c-type biogenesis protein